VPALGQATGHFEELVLRRIVHEALEEVEADAANAAFMQSCEIGVRDRRIDHGHAARFPFGLGDGVQRRGIVGAVAAGLHDHVAGEAQAIAQGEELVRPGILGKVLGLGAERKLRHRPEDVAVRVDGACGRGIERLARGRMPRGDPLRHT